MLLKILPHHIHLWQIPLNPKDASETLLTQCFAIFPPDEQERANRFVFEKHRRHFIFAHFGLRKILGDYLNIAPEVIEFNTLSHGKPELIKKQNPGTDTAPHLEFNLSHSGETALLALRTEKIIGVDIEYHSDREFLGIADHVFSDHECQAVTTAPAEQQVSAFFHIWAQKEAFIKAIGQGLSYPLKDFSVSANLPARLIEAKHEKITDWYLHSFLLNNINATANAHAAIATLNPVEKIHYFDFSYE